MPSILANNLRATLTKYYESINEPLMYRCQALRCEIKFSVLLGFGLGVWCLFVIGVLLQNVWARPTQAKVVDGGMQFR